MITNHDGSRFVRLMTPHEALEACKREVARRGYEVSAGCWSNSTEAYAFSVKTFGPNTYGHPRCEIAAKRGQDGRWMFYENNRMIEPNMVQILPPK